MKADYHKVFVKNYNKLPRKIQDKFNERLHLFYVDPFHSQLHNHRVDAAYPGWRSINITGDYRALYEPVNDSKVIFMRIGTHSELYG